MISKLVWRRDIVLALKTIRIVCRRNKQCKSCPFMVEFGGDIYCGIKEVQPSFWKISDSKDKLLDEI